MSTKPKFYQAVLEEISEKVLNNVYLRGSSIGERMESEEALCPECNDNRWWVLPKESIAVREGGKHYCQCINCGYQTHL